MKVKYHITDFDSYSRGLQSFENSEISYISINYSLCGLTSIWRSENYFSFSQLVFLVWLQWNEFIKIIDRAKMITIPVIMHLGNGNNIFVWKYTSKLEYIHLGRTNILLNKRVYWVAKWEWMRYLYNECNEIYFNSVKVLFFVFITINFICLLQCHSWIDNT